MKWLIAAALIFLALAAWWTHQIQTERNGPHWVRGWERLAQKGVAIGRGRDEYLMALLPDGKCDHIKWYTSPHMETFYSDRDKAEAFLSRSNLCGGKSDR